MKLIIKRFFCIFLCIISLGILTGCQSTNEQESFDPERAALARLKLGLGYLAQADESDDNIKAAHYNLSIANQYSPNNPNVMLGMALFDQHVGEYDEAEMIYKKITLMEPNNGTYLIHYGSFLCATDQYENARQQFNKSIALNRPQWKCDGLEQLGFCAIQNGDKQQADEAFNALFRYDSAKRKRIAKIAEIYQQKGDHDIANYLLNISK